MNHIRPAPLKTIIVLWFAGMLNVFSQTQDEAIRNLVERHEALSTRKAPESIYLQSSKGIYETEEDLWFKAYVLNSSSFKPSQLSRTLYIELIEDKTGQTAWQEKYEILNGFVDGHLYLQDSLSAGVYSLIAYSKHSFDENKEHYSTRKIRVLKKIDRMIPSDSSSLDGKIDFKLFPEGGKLISGISNKMAFKAVGSNGNPVSVNGTLLADGEPHVNFKTVHSGMGSIEFTPNANKKYSIKLFSHDKEYNFHLPQIKDSGISLKLAERTEEHLLFEIRKKGGATNESIYFGLQIRGVFYNIAASKIKNKIQIKVPLQKLPQGIAQVTVFNRNFLPVSERLVYVNLSRQLNIQTSVSDRFTTREKVVLQIRVTDQNQQPRKAHLGLSVFDKVYQQKQDPKNILSHYYLTKEIKGRIYDPAFYFDPINKNRESALDLLMLTQGWRNYNWNVENLKRLNNNPNQNITDGFTGRVWSKSNRSAYNLDQSVLIAYVPSHEQKHLMFVDSLGRFQVTADHLKLGENKNVYLKLIPPQDARLQFAINDSNFKTLNSVRKSSIPVYPIRSRNQNQSEKPVLSFVDQWGTTQLDEVMLKTKNTAIRRDKYLGSLDSLAKLALTSDYVCKENILNCPVHGPSEKGSKKPVEGEIYHLHWRTVYKNRELIAGANSSNSGPVMNPPLPPYRYPEFTDEMLMSRFNLLRFKGYYGSKEFYQPKYDDNSFDDSFTDYRNTLFWNPSIMTDQNGEATIEFFCSDLTSNFTGMIEGVGLDGLIGNYNFEFEVRRLAD